MKRCRYILNGCVLGTDMVCDYRLISGNNVKPYHGEPALKVNIPDDLKLQKLSCDSYSTTKDMRTLDKLGYDLVIWDKNKNKWIKHNEYKGIMPCDLPERGL